MTSLKLVLTYLNTNTLNTAKNFALSMMTSWEAFGDLIIRRTFSMPSDCKIYDSPSTGFSARLAYDIPIKCIPGINAIGT